MQFGATGDGEGRPAAKSFSPIPSSVATRPLVGGAVLPLLRLREGPPQPSGEDTGELVASISDDRLPWLGVMPKGEGYVTGIEEEEWVGTGSREGFDGSLPRDGSTKEEEEDDETGSPLMATVVIKRGAPLFALGVVVVIFGEGRATCGEVGGPLFPPWPPPPNTELFPSG